MQSFKEKVYSVVKKIPKGQTMPYKEVAKRAGKIKACRAVGNALNKNINPKVPCHRVICSNGQIGGYRLGKKRKMQILKKEGMVFK